MIHRRFLIGHYLDSKIVRIMLVLVSALFASIILISTQIAYAATLSCSPGYDLYATTVVNPGGSAEYRLSGSGPGVPTSSISGSGSFTVAWTLPGPGNWNVTLEGRAAGTSDPWGTSSYNSSLTLSCVTGSSGGGSGSGKSDTVEKSIPQCANLFDGRINNQPNMDCAAPVAIYGGSITVYAINPTTGRGTFAFRATDEQIEAVGIPGTNTLLGQATNPASGQLIMLHRLTTGEFQVNAWYPDGKPYVFVWDENGNKYHLAG